VLIPGILGSVLARDGKEVWAPSAKALGRAIVSLGSSVTNLALNPGEDGTHANDGVKATRLLEDVHLLPGLWKIDGYSRLQKEMLSLPGIRRGENFFAFPYDWRLDNRIAAKELAEAAPKWLSSWRKKSGNNTARLIFLTHSMGGLIARYYLECLGGWEQTRFLVSFGTPYRGSLNALNKLVNGMKIRAGATDLADLSGFVRSLTSIYQLLPTYPCLSKSNSDQLLRVNEYALPRIDPQRLANATQFHHEIEQAVAANLKTSKYTEEGYTIVPIVGTSQFTLQSGKERSDGTIEFSDNHSGQAIDGDGTVPRPSATPPELSGKNRELYVPQQHASLQNTTAVIQQITGMVKEQQIAWDQFRAGPRSLSLQVPTLVSSQDPIDVSGSYHGVAGKPEGHMVVEDLSGQMPLRTYAIEPKHGTYKHTLLGIPDGSYRITVTIVDGGGVDRQSVSDVLISMDAATH
jgi:hypothetical protein